MVQAMSAVTVSVQVMVQVTRTTMPIVNFATYRRAAANVQTKTLCKTCYQYLCSECLIFHNNLQGTRGHVVVQGDDMPRSIADKPPRFEDCEVHPKHVKGQFCFEYQTLFCCLCATTTHTGCKVLSVDDACKSISSSDITSTYDIISDFSENIKAVTTSFEQLKVEKADALEEAQDMYHKERSKFNDMYEKFKQETKENIRNSKWYC